MRGYWLEPGFVVPLQAYHGEASWCSAEVCGAAAELVRQRSSCGSGAWNAL